MGFRLQALSLLPINKTTIIYGVTVFKIFQIYSIFFLKKKTPDGGITIYDAI